MTKSKVFHQQKTSESGLNVSEALKDVESLKKLPTTRSKGAQVTGDPEKESVNSQALEVTFNPSNQNLTANMSTGEGFLNVSHGEIFDQVRREIEMGDKENVSYFREEIAKVKTSAIIWASTVTLGIIAIIASVILYLLSDLKDDLKEMKNDLIRQIEASKVQIDKSGQRVQTMETKIDSLKQTP